MKIDKNATWLQWIAPEKFNDKDLFRIVVFFVFHCPCEGVSAMGKSLDEYNWHKPWSKPFYLNTQLKQVSSSDTLIYYSNAYDKLDEKLVEANLAENFPSDFNTERIAIYNNKGSRFMSVFYHIRNAFAHGRLNMVDVKGECIFVLEDVSPKTKNVSARMILRKNTLLKWIDIIEGGEKEIQYKKSSKKKKAKK